MKLEISDCGNLLGLTNTDGLGLTVASILKNGCSDPERVARLFQKAEKTLDELKHCHEFIEAGDADCLGPNSINGLTRRDIINYIENGDKEEMVTLKMSRKTAEEINLMKFEVKEVR